MGCGCGRGRVPARRNSLKPRTSSAPKSVGKRGIAAGATPSEIRALGMQKAGKSKSQRSMNEQRRRIEKLRREAISKRFGK